MGTAAIEYKNIKKTFPGQRYDAVRDINLRVEEGSIVTILGTSGSGKTTLLKLTNRIYEPSGGSIQYFGEDIRNLPLVEFRRKLGYVIQQAGLFPHKTVKENIATVPKILGWGKSKIEERVAELLTLVQIGPEYLGRYPGKLSGGQQQRVGLARALAANPSVLLMDEPFGALDAITRKNLQDELIALQARLKNTILFVTHSVQEALKMGRLVVVMDKGEIQQADSPYAVLSNPANEFVRRLVSADDFYDKLRVLRVRELVEEAKKEELARGRITVTGDTLLNEVLRLFINSGESYFIVTGERDLPVGKVTYKSLRALAAPGTAAV
jgi:osmoprotectant transport system ATP-binding protein